MKIAEQTAEFVAIKSSKGNVRLVTPELLAAHNNDLVRLWNRLDYFELRDHRTIYTLPQIEALQASVNAKALAEQTARDAAKNEAIATIEQTYRQPSGMWVHPSIRFDPYSQILRHVGSLKSELIEVRAKLDGLKSSPAKLRAALKTAEAKAAKAKNEAAWAKLCAKAASRLNKTPKLPLKGIGFAREDFPIIGHNKKLDAIFSAIPANHKDKVAARRAKGHFSWAAVVSPEESKAFAKLIAEASK